MNVTDSRFDASFAPYSWMLASSIAFATMSTLAHGLSDRCGWQFIALTRTLLALIFAFSLAKWANVRLVFFEPKTLWLRSFAGSVSLVCTFYALTHMPVSQAITLTNTFPLWVAVISWPMLGQRPPAGVWLAIGCGIIGVVLIEQPELFSRQAGGGLSFVVDLAGAGPSLPTLSALTGALATGFALLGLHKLGGLDPRAIVVHFSAVSSAVVFVALVGFGEPVQWAAIVEPSTFAMLLGMGVAATIGQITMTRAFAVGQPARLSVVGLTQVVIAVGFDTLVWHHPFHVTTIAGMLLILAPTAWLLATQ